MLDSTVDIGDLAEYAKELEMPAVCMTDHMNIKGVVPFEQKMKAAGIKPIIGVELDVLEPNLYTRPYRLTVLARNKLGYRNIVKLVSRGNHKDRLSKEGTPQVFLEDLHQYSGGLIALAGDLQSEFSYTLFGDKWDMAYRANSLDMARSLQDPDFQDKWNKIREKYEKLFDHFFAFNDVSSLPILQVLDEAMAKFCVDTDVKWMPAYNVHYLREGDKPVHQIVLQAWIDQNKDLRVRDEIKDFRIFDADEPCCHLPDSLDDGELTLELLDLVEDYSVQERPILPKFKVGQNVVSDADSVLYEMCRKGFVDTGIIEVLRKDEELKKVYGDRIKRELEVFKKAGIASYFLIVADLMNFVKKCGLPADVRGSASGCLTSYLIGISGIDPMCPDPAMEYAPERELPFERFYNEGRNTKERAALPDIDIDLPPAFRDTLIHYAKAKYGTESVGHIITHARFKGKGAIKTIFKIMNIPFETANYVTGSMTDEQKISDELAEIQKDDPHYGIIQWNIDNVPAVADFYKTYKEAMDYAIALEKIPKNESVHAAGIIIADQPLSNLFPMRWDDKTKDLVVSIEGADIETLGAVKFDVLGVAALEKMYKIQQMVNNNYVFTTFGIDREFEQEIFEMSQ
jgi:DNA polymerase-3 subunit alpha